MTSRPESRLPVSDLALGLDAFRPESTTRETRTLNDALIEKCKADVKWWQVCDIACQIASTADLAPRHPVRRSRVPPAPCRRRHSLPARRAGRGRVADCGARTATRSPNPLQGLPAPRRSAVCPRTALSHSRGRMGTWVVCGVGPFPYPVECSVLMSECVPVQAGLVPA